MPQCEHCQKEFSNRRSLKVHLRKIHKIHPPAPVQVAYKCSVCSHECNNLNEQQCHFLSDHNSTLLHHCTYCFLAFDNVKCFVDHLYETHGLPIFISYHQNEPAEQPSSSSSSIDLSETAFEKNLKVYKLHGGEERGDVDLMEFMVRHKQTIQQVIAENVQNAGTPLKVQFCAEVDMVKTPKDNQISIYILSDMVPVYYGGMQDKDFYTMLEQLLLTLFTFTTHGSGWTVHHIRQVAVKLAKYSPMSGSSYIALPPPLIDFRKTFINIRNMTDHNCFSYCYTAAYHMTFGPSLLPEKASWRNIISPETYSSSNAHQPRGVFDMPMSLHDIDRFELLNEVQVNVYYFKSGNVMPLRISKMDFTFTLNLLLLVDDTRHHYVLITDLKRLVSKLQKKHYHTQSKICTHCLHICTSEEVYNVHFAQCRYKSPAVIKTPEPDKASLSFSHWAARHFAPRVIYFDLESILEPVASCSNHPDKSHTRELERHKPSGYGLTVVEHGNPVPIEFQVLRSENCMEELLRNLERIAKETHQAKQRFREYNGPEPDLPQRQCWICEKDFSDEDIVVLDHCHYSGQFLGWAHRVCNINRKTINFTPVIAHNLQNYDLHHIVKALAKLDSKHTVSIIPLTSEKYISLSVGIFIRTYKNNQGRNVNVFEYLRFIDSYKFMLSKLENLANNLPRDKFQLLDNHFAAYSNTDRELLYSKGFYPYSYITSENVFNETDLPPLPSWRNTLTGQCIEQKDLEKAKKVFNTFHCRSIGDYHNLYLATDVLILADVFEEFRSLCYRTYGLDCAHHYTASNLAGDAFLKICKADVKLLCQREHLEIVENLLRGGISSVYAKRHFKANNKYLANFDEKCESTFGFMIDVNNLYGGIMQHSHLPLSDFTFVDSVSLDQILATPHNSSTGYILEVDLSYPDHLHDSHQDFPLAPEKQVIDKDLLSDFQLQISPAAATHKTIKLVQTLYNKTHYCLHYLTLQLYKDLGMEITKVYRVLQFKQSNWLAPYITLNTANRKCAKNKFEEDYFKLMANSAYGKCCENKRNRVRAELIRDKRHLQEGIAKPTLKEFRIFDETLAMLIFKQASIYWDKPTLVGAVILDLAKLFMFEFHYMVMKKQFDCTLLYSDTDSFLYEIRTDDLYRDLQNKDALRQQFDLSNYPESSPLYNNDNKMVVLKWKDEMKGEVIKEFCGLKYIMYSIITEGMNRLYTFLFLQLDASDCYKCTYRELTKASGCI